MALSFAGVSLPLVTPEVAGYLDSYLPLDQIVEQVSDHFATGLARLPHPPVPPDTNHASRTDLKLGRLYWPADASRCATFHQVVNYPKLAEILDAIGTDCSGEFVLSDGVGGEVSTTLYCGQPRPLFQITSDFTKQLYLLSLVDQRALWRWEQGSITEQPVSWTHLFSLLSAIVGTTITPDSIPAAYGTPSERWVTHYRPLPALIDAAAAAVGQKIVVGLDGTVRSVNWETARLEFEEQWADQRKVAGGEFLTETLQRFVPASVTVAFGRTTGEDRPHTVEKTLASLGMTAYGSETGLAGRSQLVNADLVYAGTSSAAACDDLAAVIAEDWYGWATVDTDATLPGAVAWEPTGAEDAVEWNYKLAEGERAEQITTRVHRGPWLQYPPGDWAPPFDSEPLVRVIERTTGSGEYGYRYLVRAVEVVTTGSAKNLEDIVTSDGYVQWSDVVEIEDREVTASASPVPEQGVFTLKTAPNGQKYFDHTTGDSASGSGSGSGSGDDGDEGTSRLVFYLETVNCEDGLLAVYKAPVYQYDNMLIESGDPVFDRYEGCCECDDQSGSGFPVPCCDEPAETLEVAVAGPFTSGGANCIILGTLAWGGSSWSGSGEAGCGLGTASFTATVSCSDGVYTGTFFVTPEDGPTLWFTAPLSNTGSGLSGSVGTEVTGLSDSIAIETGDPCAGAEPPPPPITTGCCPSDPVPQTLSAVVTLGGTYNGTYALTYRSGVWSFILDDGAIGSCGAGGTEAVLALQCNGSNQWEFYTDDFVFGPFTPTTEACNPFQLVFDNVNFSLCGVQSGATVTITA